MGRWSKIKLSMKVLLLNPLANINGRYAHFHRDWCGGELPTSVAFPPLDLASAAALLREKAIDVYLLDASVLHLSHNRVLEIASEEKPDYVAIPSAWGSLTDDLHLCQLLKQRLPEIKIVLSGPNATVHPSAALHSDVVDYVILGEIEVALLDIIQGDISHNIAYKNNGAIITTDRKLFDDLDSLPFAARDLLPNKKYNASFLKRNPFTLMMTSRGCPYKCTFCQNHIWYLDKVRFRSTKNVVDEIEEIVIRYGIPQIIFRDLTFTFNKSHLFSICEEIIRRSLRVSWRCFSCVDSIDKKTLELMKRAGCHQISYGVESASQKVLDLTKKGVTVQQVKKAVILTKKEGIETCCDFMIGMYGDTEDSIQKTIDFALELDPDYAQFQIAAPVYSTEFYNQCFGKEPQPFEPKSMRWYRWNVTNPQFSRDYLNKRLKEAYRRFYLRRTYILKQLTRIRTPKRLYLVIKTGSQMLRQTLFNY